jgi:sugar lactone lactonase YvrE
VIDMYEPHWLTGRIHTFAGTGAPGYSGDDGPAREARLNGPAGLAVDAYGNVYVADMLNHAIRRVNAATGTIETVVGCGAAGFGGDGGPACKALLNHPEGVAVNRNGDIFIADSLNHRIRKVDANTGLIGTIAGCGVKGYGGDGGRGADAMLNHPAGVVVDYAGNAYCNDYGNDRIRKITPDGFITTYAGTGRYGYDGDGGPAAAAWLNDVYGLAMGADDALYIMDSLNFAVRKVDLASGVITTILGKGVPGDSPDGTRSDECFIGGEPHHKGEVGGKVPHAVDADRFGHLFVAETGMRRIRVVDRTERRIYTVAGNGEPGRPQEGADARTSPLGVHGLRAGAKDDLYFNDFHSHAVFVVQFG